MNSSSGRTGVGALQAMLICLLLTVVCTYPIWSTWKGSATYEGMTFNRQLWIKYRHNSAENPRCKMVADILQHHVKPGMTTEEITTLLGFENEYRSDQFFIISKKEKDPRISQAYFYTIGRTSFFVWEALYIYFDTDHKVIGTEILPLD